MGFPSSEPRRAKLRTAAKIALGCVYVLASPVVYFYVVYKLMSHRVTDWSLNSSEVSWLYKIIAGSIAMIFSLIQAIWATPKALFYNGYHAIYDKISPAMALAKNNANTGEGILSNRGTTKPLTKGMDSVVTTQGKQTETGVPVKPKAWEYNPFDDSSTFSSKSGGGGNNSSAPK